MVRFCELVKTAFLLKVYCMYDPHPPPHSSQVVEAETLTEIFRDNAHLCSKVTESEVQHFVHCIEKSRNVKYLKFFQTIVQGGKGSRRAQEMVTEEVMDPLCMVVCYCITRVTQGVMGRASVLALACLSWSLCLRSLWDIQPLLFMFG